MEFRIADTFTDSLARLTNDEQKAVKTTAFDLQLDPANPGMQFHKLDRAKDKNFWSVRVGRDVRLIVHKTAGNLLLCYAGHHDDAYNWAERRKIERHPATGAAQLVEVRERVQEVVIPKYVEQAAPLKPALFAKLADEKLLEFGIPTEWIGDVKKATEDSLLDLADHLPREAAEALLDLATGATPRVTVPAAAGQDPFEHPDARSRFRLMSDVKELERALDAPWEKWSVFLHPAQQDLVERQFNGPARVAGSAGTGKTVVALHRAAFLVRSNPAAKLLLTTFSDPLANMLRSKLGVLLGNEPAIQLRITVEALNTLAIDLYGQLFGKPNIADETTIRQKLRESAQAVGGKIFSERFLWSEWDEVVDAWNLRDWEQYRTVNRLGRKTRLAEAQRRALWQIFERVQSDLASKYFVTTAGIFARLTEHFASGARSPFDFAVIDEAQDISVSRLRFLAALVGHKTNGLFFTGDLGQRIFQSPFSWKSLGVDVRGRSHTLRVNYRTSHQIRRQADRLLPSTVSDVDGLGDERSRTVSVFNGPEPRIMLAAGEAEEITQVANWLRQRIDERFSPHEIGIFVRSIDQLPRAQRAVETAGLEHANLDAQLESEPQKISIATMHLAKGMEFRAVAVMACDDDVVPLQERVEAVADESDLAEVYTTERHLLYVACTRARDQLLISAVRPGSEFLQDMRGA